jgi:citrate synthase
MNEGLEGVVVGETRLSHVDGERGRLVVAGFDIEQLAGAQDFEQAVALLLSAAGEPVDAATVRESLAHARAQAFERLPSLGDALTQANGMDALRAAVAHLPEGSTWAQVIGAVGVFAAAWSRRGRVIAPAGDSHAEALLRMFGVDSHTVRVRALDAYLVTVLDHGFNASTFAARVVASTRSDLVSAVVAGIGALKGPLHGGAPGPVLDMLAAIAEPTGARAYLEAELQRGQRIMGMGHRIYRQRDPRAFVLERALEQLSAAVGAQDGVLRRRLALARTVEQEAERLLEQRYPGRQLKANVEFYTAVLLSALDIPGSVFSSVFACARCAGWAAHFAEQRALGRLIRPSARYVGAMP